MHLMIVDDDPIVVQSLKNIVERISATNADPIRVVATAGNGEEAISRYQEHRPDLILMDIRMHGMDGLEAAERLLSLDSEASILFLTTFLDDAYIATALRLGARGYLQKSNIDALVPALYAARNHQHVYGDSIIEKMSDAFQRKTPERRLFASLKETEMDIVRLVAEGKNNKEIAQTLHFSEGTIRNYLSRILEELDLRDRTQLAIAYYRENQ